MRIADENNVYSSRCYRRARASRLSLILHGADHVHRTSNNRRSHSTQCISRGIRRYCERNAISRGTQRTVGLKSQTARRIREKNAFFFRRRRIDDESRRVERESESEWGRVREVKTRTASRTERQRGVPTRSLALRETERERERERDRERERQREREREWEKDRNRETQ